MSITTDFRRITKRMDDVLAASHELDHGDRKRPKTGRATLGTGLSKLEQKALVRLRGTLHPSVVELVAVAAGASWPHLPVRTFLSRLDLLGRYPKALARQERLSSHTIDGLLLATSGHMAYLAASGASLQLFVAGRTKRFASVKNFLAFIEEEVEARAEWTDEALAQRRADEQRAKSAKARGKNPRRLYDDAAAIVDAIDDPPRPRSPEARAFVSLRRLRMLGPEGELVDAFVNEGVGPFLEAARYAQKKGKGNKHDLGAAVASLHELIALLIDTRRAVRGATFSARNRQAHGESGSSAIDDVCTWCEQHESDLTLVLAEIAKTWRVAA